jgi:hypothetical protein
VLLSDNLKTDIIPTRLYKFVSHDSKNMTITGICKGYVKFSKIPDLNDSSEEYVYANFEEFRKSVKEIFGSECSLDVFEKLEKQFDLVNKIFPEMGLSKIKNEFKSFTQRMCGCNPKFGNLLAQNKVLFKALEDNLAQIHKEILSKVGIFCVTDRLGYFPMWAHYADEARGFAVEFKDLHQCFNGDGTGALHQVDPVKYRGQRGLVSMMPSDLSEIFRTKLEDWKEEHEYRVTELLTQCEYDDHKKVYLYRIDCKYISRIIVGWKCPTDRFKVIKEIADDAGIEVVRLRMDKQGKIVPA